MANIMLAMGKVRPPGRGCGLDMGGIGRAKTSLDETLTAWSPFPNNVG